LIKGSGKPYSGAGNLQRRFEEIIEVIKICVAQGMQASNLGVPILADELDRVGQKEKS
jgi:hypothetical protein